MSLPAAALVAVALGAGLDAGCPAGSRTGSRTGAAADAASRDEALERALGELASPAAAERLRAQRWIATHAAPADFPRLAEAVAGGDAEVRARVRRALGGEDRNLELSLLFAGESQPELEAVGRDALAEMLLRWAPELDRLGLVQGTLHRHLLALQDRYQPTFLELDLAAPTPVAVDRIARNGDVPLPLVLDPELDRPVPESWRSRAGYVTARGVWDQLLVFVAQRDELGLEGHGFGDAPEDGAVGFVRVCPRRDEGRQPGTDLVLEWLLASGRAPTPVERAAAARALASTAWPAAVEWLGERWRADGDLAALEGLLVAAARGQVASVLPRPEAVRAVLEQADRDFAGDPAGRRRAWAALDALASLAPLGAGGASLAAPLLEGWDELEPAARWFRMAALEGMAPGDERAREALRGVLGDGAAAPALLRQALRTWTALSLPTESAAPWIGDPLRAFEGLGEGAELRELVQVLILAGVAPPTDDPGELPGDGPAIARAIALGEWWLASGDVERAVVAFFSAELADDPNGEGPGASAGERSTGSDPNEPPDLRRRRGQELAARVLRDWVFRGERELVGDVFESARAAGVPAPVVRRTALLAGHVPAAEHAELGPAPDAEDPLVLGVLAAGPLGEESLARLRERVDAGFAGELTDDELEAVLRGVERAHEEMFLAGQDERADRFARELRSAARRRPSSALAERMLQPGWPDPPRQVPRRLRLLDRRLEPGEL